MSMETNQLLANLLLEIRTLSLLWVFQALLGCFGLCNQSVPIVILTSSNRNGFLETFRTGAAQPKEDLPKAVVFDRANWPTAFQSLEAEDKEGPKESR